MTGVYMAGPVAALPDGGAGWRYHLMDERPEIKWLNPLEQYNVPADDVQIRPGDESIDDEGAVSVGQLVRNDKMLIDAADAVLVGYSAVRQIGTPMEVMFAYDRNIPVSVWIRDGTDIDDLSPWYRYHAATISHDRDTAVDYLTNQI